MRETKFKPRSTAFALGLAAVLLFTMCLYPAAVAHAVTIADITYPGAVAMDTERYSDTVQIPVTLYDYGCEVDGEWVTKDPTVLNEGLDCATNWEAAEVDKPATMRFWDAWWTDWLTPGNPSSFLDEDGSTLKGGMFRWGMFEPEFSNWSDIIAVPSRDLFGKDSASCSYGGTCFKQVYDDVLMDFSYDRSNNTYHYSSKESWSRFDGDGHISKTERVAESNPEQNMGFWPFGEVEVHFGMTMDFDFYLPSQAYLDNNEYFFAFSGDDDLVVYVDDKLTLDLGGAHGAVPGYIDFANQIVVYGTTFSEAQMESFSASVANSGTTMNTSGFDEAGVDWNADTYGYVTFDELGIELEPSSEHNFKLAYLERGGDASNLLIEMNMQIQANVDYEIVGDVVPDPELTDAVPVDEQTYDLYDEYTAKPGMQTSDEGYYFLGWYTDEECTDKWVDGTLLTSAQTTLYGRWVEATALKSSDPESGETVKPGQKISYEVDYRNSDTVSQKVIVTDAVPQHTKLVEDSVACEEDESCSKGELDTSMVHDGSGVVCATWSDVAPGESVKLRFDVVVDADAAAGTLVENKADIGVNDGQISLSTNKVEHEVVVPGEEPLVDPADPEDVDTTGTTSGNVSAKGYVPKTGDVGIAVIGVLLACVGSGIALLLKALVSKRRICGK